MIMVPTKKCLLFSKFSAEFNRFPFIEKGLLLFFFIQFYCILVLRVGNCSSAAINLG